MDTVVVDVTTASASRALTPAVARQDSHVTSEESSGQHRVELLQVLPDHLKLGITALGFENFLRRSKWPESYRRNDPARIARGGRDVTKWADGSALTGYDLCEHIKDWLRRHGHEGKSVCEVLLGEKSAHIKLCADCFVSHIQSRTVNQLMGTLRQAAVQHCEHLPVDPALWIDYVCVRQCQKGGFNLPQIGALINEIGCTLLELDRPAKALRRSWCIFEMFVTVNQSRRLLIVDERLTTLSVCELMRLGRHFILFCSGRGAKPALYAQRREELMPMIASEDMDASEPEDKETVANYIRGGVGFNELDDRIREALDSFLDHNLIDTRFNHVLDWVTLSACFTFVLYAIDVLFIGSAALCIATLCLACVNGAWFFAWLAVACTKFKKKFFIWMLARIFHAPILQPFWRCFAGQFPTSYAVMSANVSFQIGVGLLFAVCCLAASSWMLFCAIRGLLESGSWPATCTPLRTYSYNATS
jgi:hypothetical protein